MVPFLLWLATFCVGAQPSVDARHVSVAAPQMLARIDTSSSPGKASRLAWSPDGSKLYLRVTQRDMWANERHTHYLVSLNDRSTTRPDGEPEWVAAYWAWKSALASAGAPDFRIVVETREERKTATGVVSAGSMAQSGGDPSLGAILGPQGQAIAQSTMQAQNVTTTTLKVRGQLLGEYVNEAVTSGVTYGWAPGDMKLLAFVTEKGRLSLMDAAGHKQSVGTRANWVLPAWSPDGTRLACLRPDGKKQLEIHIFTVSSSR